MTEMIIVPKASSQLRCERLIAIADGYDNQGNRRCHHERCGQPAREVRIGGMLTSATAILCEQHHDAAKRETLVSKKGYDVRHRPLKAKHDELPLLPFRGK